MLTPKQQRFCEEYLIDLNAAGAYRRAGYRAANDNTAWVNASKLLRNHKVEAYIAELRAAQTERTMITADRTLMEVARVAFACITDVVSFDDSGIIFKDSITDDARAAIAEVSSDTQRQSGSGDSALDVCTIKRRIKMHNKLEALKLLMAYLGLTSDFNSAVATLQKYGLVLKQTDATESGWEVLISGDRP